MSKRVGVVGVGAMGKLMAAQLLKKGYTVTVCPHRNRQPVEELAAQGAQVAENPAGVAAASEVVVTMVPDAPQVETLRPTTLAYPHSSKGPGWRCRPGPHASRITTIPEPLAVA